MIDEQEVREEVTGAVSGFTGNNRLKEELRKRCGDWTDDVRIGVSKCGKLS
jgi:hypothetical protein